MMLDVLFEMSRHSMKSVLVFGYTLYTSRRGRYVAFTALSVPASKVTNRLKRQQDL